MSDERPKVGWRVKVGFAIFVASIGWPVLIPILPLLGVSTTTTAAFVGVMLVVAEFMLIAGAAIAGKEGFALIKATVFGFEKAVEDVVSPLKSTSIKVKGRTEMEQSTAKAFGMPNVVDAGQSRIGFQPVCNLRLESTIRARTPLFTVDVIQHFEKG